MSATTAAQSTGSGARNNRASSSIMLGASGKPATLEKAATAGKHATVQLHGSLQTQGSHASAGRPATTGRPVTAGNSATAKKPATLCTPIALAGRKFMTMTEVAVSGIKLSIPRKPK